MRLFLVLIGLMMFAPGAAFAHQQVYYEIRYVDDPVPWLEVTATFSSDGGGFVSLFLPTTVMRDGVNQSRISDVEILSAFSELNLVSGNHYYFNFAPDGTGILRYRISGTVQELPDFATPWTTSQIVTNRYVHLSASNTLALPSWAIDGYDWDEDIAVRIDWLDLPRRWTTADSFGRGRTSRRFHSSVIDLFGSRFVAGNLATATRNVHGTRIQIAMLGRWPFGVRQYANRVAAMAQAHHDFWGDDRSGGYLATLIPIDGPLGYLGEGNEELAQSANANTNASTIFATQSTPLSRLEGTISHEYLHRWIEAAFGNAEAPIQASRWFTEGFTSFYASYIPLQAGVTDHSDFLFAMMHPYLSREFSSYANASQDEMIEGWSYGGVMTSVPYWRGHLLAADWQAAIQEATDGEMHLHDILFEFRAQQDALRESGEPWMWNSESLISLMETHGFDFAREDYQRVLVGGGELELSAATNGPCLIPEQASYSAPSEGAAPLFGGVAFPAGAMSEDDMSADQRAACRAWLDLD